MTLARDPFQVRIHGRGGQGVVTAAELLSAAGFLDGYEAQAFPSFGSERMGAPVTSFCRMSTSPIRVREPVMAPDAVLVLDATLLHHVDVFDGLTQGGFVLVNSERSADELGIESLVDVVGAGHLGVAPATRLARRFTGVPRPNVASVAALAALTGVVSLAGLEGAIRNRFAADSVQDNVQLAEAGYEWIGERSRA